LTSIKHLATNTYKPEKRISKPLPENHKSLSNQDVTKNGKTDLAEKFALILVDHPELEQILLTWPRLPVAIKKAVVKIVKRNQ